MKRYTHIVLRRMPPLNGFSIKTPEAKFLSDIRPRGIVRELNRLNDRIKRLEEAGDEMICHLSHNIKTDHSDPIWHSASIKWGKVKKEAKL